MLFLWMSINKQCFCVFRLKSYVRKTRTIQIDSAKVTYIAADKEVKVYADTSNGIKRNSKNVSTFLCYTKFCILFLLFH